MNHNTCKDCMTLADMSKIVGRKVVTLRTWQKAGLMPPSFKQVHGRGGPKWFTATEDFKRWLAVNQKNLDLWRRPVAVA